MSKEQEKKIKLYHVRVIMTEEQEMDVSLLFKAIIAEMRKKKVDGAVISEFVRLYFRAKEVSADAVRALFNEWVRLQRPVVK